MDASVRAAVEDRLPGAGPGLDRRVFFSVATVESPHGRAVVQHDAARVFERPLEVLMFRQRVADVGDATT